MFTRSIRLSLAIAAFVCSTFLAGAVAQTAPTGLPPGIQESLNNLADQPATHTGFTFDRSMMRAAQGFLESGGLESDRAVAAVTSISFDTYRFPRPAFYTPETMAAIVAGYHRAGWKHLVDGNGNRSPANSPQPRRT